MLKNIFLIIIFIFLAQACSNKEKLEYEPQAKSDPYKLYQEGFNASTKKVITFLQIKNFLKQS